MSDQTRANVWCCKRKDLSWRNLDDYQLELKILGGKILGILNKIAPENFKELSVQMLQLGIDNMDKIDIAAETICDKAYMELLYVQTYSNLCKIMGSIKLPEQQDHYVSPFGNALLHKCQKEFFSEGNVIKEVDIATKTELTEKEGKEKMTELMYQRNKLKERMLGNAVFIGELFNVGMLSSNIILSQCIGNLLPSKRCEKPVEMGVECLAKLFTVVGKKLETEYDNEMTLRAFEDSFGVFKVFANDTDYHTRIRFMVQDVVDLRENSWIPRRIRAKPQRIEDIHTEHEREEQEKKMEAALAKKSKSRAVRRDKRGRGSRDGRMESKHDFNTVPIRVNTNIDMSKIPGANQKLDNGSRL